MTDHEQRAAPGQTAKPDQQTSPGAGPGPTSFDDPRVDSAVARTDGLDERAVNEHVQIFDDVHRSFRDALDDPGDDPGDAPGHGAR